VWGGIGFGRHAELRITVPAGRHPLECRPAASGYQTSKNLSLKLDGTKNSLLWAHTRIRNAQNFYESSV
jgi:hypothetical protein